jgi:hypothetical protein
MNTNKRQVQVMDRPTSQLSTLMSLQTQALVQFGDDMGWDPAVLGQAPLPQEPVRVGDWLIVPAEQDSSVIPDRAFKRVQALYAASIQPKGFVLVHEAPALLAAPVQAQQSPAWRSKLPQARETAAMLAKAGGALAASAAVAALAVVAVGAVIAVALPIVALAGAVAIDPILIAVTDDDHWIEIDRWDIQTH